MSSVSARFFPPQVAGAGASGGITPGVTYFPFRIDHDERYNQTTHLQYQIKTYGPWFGFNWRFDSGLVAGSSPCYNLTSNYPNTSCPNSSYGPDGLPATLNGATAVSLVDNNIPASTRTQCCVCVYYNTSGTSSDGVILNFGTFVGQVFNIFTFQGKQRVYPKVYSVMIRTID